MKKVLISTLILAACFLSGCSSYKKPAALTEDDIITYSEAMADNPYSSQLTLNGILYTIPFDARELTDQGFFYNDPQYNQEELEDHSYAKLNMALKAKDQKSAIEVEVYNMTGATITIENAKIGSVSIKTNDGAQVNTIVLPQGITLQSTYDEIINTYGPADTDSFENGGWIHYTTATTEETDTLWNELKFQFHEDGTISEIYIRNFELI